MFRTVLLAGLLYGYYATGHIAFLMGAFVGVHIVQESIISSLRESDEIGAIRQLMSKEVHNEERAAETETD